MKTVVIERDIDQDRFVTYTRFKEFINWFPSASKWQVYFALSGTLGWRPCEYVKINIKDIDPEGQRIKRKIAKPKRKENKFKCDVCERKGTIFQINADGSKDTIKCPECEGKGYIDFRVEIQKVKWSYVVDWAWRLLQLYIKRNYLTMRGGYIFPSKDSATGHMHRATPCTYLNRFRVQLYKEHPKWNWVKDYYETIEYRSGKIQKHYNLACYSFRKMHAAYYAQMLLDRGYTDVVLQTSKYMGHNDPRTTMKYLRNLIPDEPILKQGFPNALDFNLEFEENRPKVTRDQIKLDKFL